MGATGTEQHTSALDLDRWILAGRPSEHPVAEHAAGCQACRARLEAPGVTDPGPMPGDALIEQRVDAIFREAEARRAGPLARLAALVRQPWAMATAGAAAALVLVLFAAPSPLDLPEEAHRGLGWKAGGEVLLQVSAGGSPLAAGAVLAPGAALSVHMTVTKTGYLALVSVDAEGEVSRVLPARGDEATAVERGVAHARGGVSGSRGIERLIVLFDKEPFHIGDAAAAAAKALPSGPASDLIEAGSAPRVAASWWFRHAEGSR